MANEDQLPFRTIRHINCTILQSESRSCEACTTYRNNLKALLKKGEKTENKPSHNTNYRYMSKTLMKDSIVSLRATIKHKNHRISYLENQIQTDPRSTLVSKDMHDDLLSVMGKHNEDVLKSFPEDSFQHIFWSSQYNAAQQKSSTGLRWNPAMIRWCIFLQQKSSAAYDLIRKSNCIRLPSQRTLRRYTQFYNASTGFSCELDEQMMRDSKIQSLEYYQKFVSIIGDEMYIKQKLVYNNSTGDLVGYCDIGDINNHLVQLEKEYTNPGTCTGEHDTLAKTMMVLMVRGLFINFTFPYASFASSTLTGEQLIPIFYEAIMRVERCGFKVSSITLDGHSVNRKFIKLISCDTEMKTKHKFKNPMSESNQREIYLFSDPSHLIKTVRNCLANPKRHMEVIIIVIVLCLKFHSLLQ